MTKKQRKRHLKRLRRQQRIWHNVYRWKPFEEPDDDPFEDWHEPEVCDECGGSGQIIECCDDMCHGQGDCIHGDVRMCPVCHGTGEV